MNNVQKIDYFKVLQDIPTYGYNEDTMKEDEDIIIPAGTICEKHNKTEDPGLVKVRCKINDVEYARILFSNGMIRDGEIADSGKYDGGRSKKRGSLKKKRSLKKRRSLRKKRSTKRRSSRRN